MFTWTTLSIIFKVHSRSGRYLTLPRVTAPDSLQTQAEFHLHTSQHFKAFLQSFRTENARVAATKTPHGSEAIFGSKFIAGRDLLSWSVLLHAAFGGAAGPRALMGEGNSLSPRQWLKGGPCGECVGLVWGPGPRWEAAVNTNTVPGTAQGAQSSCLREIAFRGPRQRHLRCRRSSVSALQPSSTAGENSPRHWADSQRWHSPRLHHSPGEEEIIHQSGMPRAIKPVPFREENIPVLWPGQIFTQLDCSRKAGLRVCVPWCSPYPVLTV